VSAFVDMRARTELFRAGSGNLDSVDKWIFCLNAA
jgi:hypothetical protein